MSSVASQPVSWHFRSHWHSVFKHLAVLTVLRLPAWGALAGLVYATLLGFFAALFGSTPLPDLWPYGTDDRHYGLHCEWSMG